MACQSLRSPLNVPGKSVCLNDVDSAREGPTLEDGAGHGQQARAAPREKFNGSSHEAIRAEPSKMNSTQNVHNRTLTSTFPSWIAAVTALTRATRQRVQHIVSFQCPLNSGHSSPFSTAALFAFRILAVPGGLWLPRMLLELVPESTPTWVGL